VYSTLGNIISRVNVEVGDRVSAGQTLSVLDADRENVEIVIAESAVENARLELEIIEDSHERFAMLYYEGAIAQIELRRIEDSLAQAQNNYNHAQDVLSALRATWNRHLERHSITAPIGGTITAVFAREGEIAHGILFVIEDTDNLRIIARFREYDLDKVRVGTPVTITADATGNVEYTGVISMISPSAVRDAHGNIAPVVEFETEIQITSEETDLRIGMTTRVTIDFSTDELNYDELDYDE
jgi:RND family efflux transporter MFP subunit